MAEDEIEEGSPCNQDNCKGHFALSDVVGCSCHINPPCSACVDAGYTCDTCGHDTAPHDPEEFHEPPLKFRDRTGEYTSTYTDSPFNSTPFTRCCGTAAIDTDRCPSCNAQITHHDDGLSERRKWANGGCLMCGKPVGDISISGNCHC